MNYLIFSDDYMLISYKIQELQRFFRRRRLRNNFEEEEVDEVEALRIRNKNE